MSWSVERWSIERGAARRSLLATAIAIASMLAIPGCYDAHPCEGEERCNLADDDCDGFVDEGFVDEEGGYTTIEACGTCGIDCRAVFPTAEMVACSPSDEGPICELVSCFPGFHFGGEGACVPDVETLCLPCTEDVDCSVRLPGTLCLDTTTGARRCGRPCDDATAPCPDGFSCERIGDEALAQCVPTSGICGCTTATAGTTLACLLESPTGDRCAGIQICGEDGPTACEPALEEACNLQDDDCDGAIDEDFVDELGRYVSRYHCGACAVPCTEPGPNMVAECVAGGAVTCEIECAEGFVDVNRILADGCECERWDGMGPPPIIGGDADCDGIPDDTTDFVYVTTAGSDTNPGTLARPMRTINAASMRARTEGKDVLVARGIYEGPIDIVGGVSIYGGYAPDFSDRDLTLFPVLLERTTGEPGQPALTCRNITAATEIEGFVIQGSDAVREGEGSTAVTLDGCGPAVVLRAIEILAGRGADGVRGDDSSVNLREWGFTSLNELDGESGSDGFAGTEGGACLRVAGGAGSRHFCGPGRTIDVSGGVGGAAECPGAICDQSSPCGNAGCTDFTVGGTCDLDAARADATANPAAGAGRGPGAGAAGALTYNSPTNRGVCNFCDDNPTLPREGQAGGDGAIGGNGGAGLGCSARPTITSDGRVSGGDGTSGTAGVDGGGGGGGTAGGGYEVIGGTAGECGDRSGGSGGGGGSGGCGAPGADGGTGGGFGVGIFVRTDASGRGPTFEMVRVVTASGGDGGDGGVGADGGVGGIGAAGGVGRFWCARTGGRGGDGGRGGAGGGGGGGCGGGSHGVFIVSSSGEAYRDLVSASVTIEATGVAGRAGRGGFSPGAGGGDGSAGTSAPVLLTAP